jgi:DNA-directed RNA polymerase subunit RPC12/RpoP
MDSEEGGKVNYLQVLTHHDLTDRLKRPPGTPESDCQGMLLLDQTFDDDRPIVHHCGECGKPKESDNLSVKIYVCRQCGHTIVVKQYDTFEYLVNDFIK